MKKLQAYKEMLFGNLITHPKLKGDSYRLDELDRILNDKSEDSSDLFWLDKELNDGWQKINKQ